MLDEGVKGFTEKRVSVDGMSGQMRLPIRWLDGKAQAQTGYFYWEGVNPETCFGDACMIMDNG